MGAAMINAASIRGPELCLALLLCCQQLGVSNVDNAMVTTAVVFHHREIRMHMYIYIYI